MTRSIMTCGVLAACAGGLLLPMTAAAGPEDDAKAVFQRAMDAYGELDSYSDKLLSKFEIKVAGAPMPMDQVQEEDLALVFERPGRFAVTGAEQIEVYSDGETVTTYIPSLAQYTQTPYDATKKMRDYVTGDFADMLVLTHPVASMLVDGIDSPEDLPLIKKLTGTEKKERNGKAGTVVLAQVDLSGVMPLTETVPAHYWFDDESGMLEHVTLDLSENMQKMFNQQAAAMGIEMTVNLAEATMAFNDVEINEKIDAAAYAFVPAAGAKEVDTFMEPGMGAADAPSQDALVGKPAPTFTGTGLDGQAISLASYSGKVVVMDFWATWCGPCRRAMPSIQEISADYADRGVVVIGVNRDDPRQEQKVLDYCRDNKITFRHIVDKTNSIARDYLVTGIPCTVIIDGKGVIQAIHTGFAPGGEKKYREEIEKLLKGENLF